MKTVKTIGIFTKLISVFLTLLLIFYIIPSTVYAEVVGAFSISAEENEQINENIVPEDETPIYEYKGQVYEAEELREESVKHFHLEDGSYVAAQYNSPVHYKDENGAWQDIDNSLHPSGSDYSNSNARIKFSKKVTGNSRIFALHDGNMKITMSLIGAVKGTEGTVYNNPDAEGETELQKLMALEKLSSRILYEEILDVVDLEYIASGLSVKENIIVKQRKDTYSYSFELALNGLDAILTESGDISLVSESGEEKYIIPAPVVYDAENVYADRGVSNYSLENQGNGKYILTVSVSSEWMNAEERAFPVVIDPAVQPTANYVMDTTVYEDHPNTAYGNATYLEVGPGAVSYLYAGILGSWKYDYISQVQIGMKAISGSNQHIAVYPALYWDESSTWNTVDISGDIPYTLWPEWDALDYQYIVSSNTENDGWYYWNATNVVWNWYVDEMPYSGVCFAPLDEDGGTVRFESSESANSESRPYMLTKYRNMNGIEDYWTTTSQSAGVAGSGSVNVANGNLTFVIPTLTTLDSLIPYTPALVYNMNNAGVEYDPLTNFNSYTPYGFKMNITETVVGRTFKNIEDEVVKYYVYSDSDGTEHYFYQSGNGVFLDEDGLNKRIDVNESSTILTITDDSKTVRTFEKYSENQSSEEADEWYLVSISDKSGNKVSFTFDTAKRPIQISTVPNGVAPIKQLDIIYNSDGRVSVIYNEHSGDAVLFKYSPEATDDVNLYDTKYLKEVIFATLDTSTIGSEEISSIWQTYYEENPIDAIITVNATASYTYDEYGNLISADDNLAKYKLEYEITNIYSNYFAVTRIDEYAGEEQHGQTIAITIDNARKYSEVRNSGSNDVYGDNDDAYIHYSFDENGRAISVYSGTYNGEVNGVSAGEFQENESAINSLKYKVSSSGAGASLIVNGDFSEATDGIPDYWSLSGAATRQVKNKDEYYIRLSPSANQTATLTQYVQLVAGEYTLSMPITSYACDGMTAKVKITSRINSPLYHVEEIALSKDTVRTGDFATTFTVPNYSQNGDKIKITIEVTSGDAVESGNSVDIEKVMLEKGIGATKFNMVNVGGFESSSITSTGSTAARASKYWSNENNLAPSIEYKNNNTSLKIYGDINKEKYAVQRIYSAPQTVLDEYNEPGEFFGNHKEYLLQAKITANNAAYCDDAFVGIRVDIVYYQGLNEDNSIKPNVIRTLLFEAKSFNTSYICDYFTTEYIPDEGDMNDYSCVKSIDVYCVYSYQFENTTAYFDNIAVFECDSNNYEEYEYYDNGLLKSKESIFYKEVYAYDENRNLAVIANNYGELTENTYDSLDRLTLSVNYDFERESGRTVYPIDAENPDALITKTAKTVTEYDYDNYGLLLQENSYEVNDALLPVETAQYLTRSYTYNTGWTSRIFGALASETDSLSNTIEYRYNILNGRLVTKRNVTDGTGLHYTYDEIGNLLSVKPTVYSPTTDSYSVQSDSASVQYYYDTKNQLQRLITKTTTYFFTYDDFGNIVTVKAGDKTLASYTYNNFNGKVAKMTYGNGLTVEYVYDALENVSEVWYKYNDETSEQAYAYEYTAYGQLYKVSDLINEKDTVYTYDTNQRLIGYAEYELGEMYGDSSASLLYNDRGQLELYSYKLNYDVNGVSEHDTISYSYTYNTDGSLKSLSSNYNAADFTATYSYDDFGRSSGYILISDSGTTTDYRNEVGYIYDEVTKENEYGEEITYTSSRIKTYSSKVNNGTALTYTYTYDESGNITKITYSTGEEIRYVYDDLNQLIREDNPFFSETYVITYDNAGNILFKKVYNLTAAGVTPTSLKDEREYGYAGGFWKDLLTSYWDETITYDGIGNPLYYFNGSEQTFTWLGRQLQSVTNGNGSFTFEYNADGIRTAKYRNNNIFAQYFLDGDRIVGERRANEMYIYIYDASGSPIGFQYRKDTYAADVWDSFWYEKNVQGDIVAVYNDAGVKLVSYVYNAWGAFSESYSNGGVSTAAYKNPFLYRGYYYDRDINFYYLNSRYYDFKTGRFVNSGTVNNSVDGTLGKNLFVYSGNNAISAGVNKFIAESLSKPTQLISTSVLTALIVLHNVPVYDQGDYPLCWAFCHYMVEDYFDGIIRDNETVLADSKALYTKKFGKDIDKQMANGEKIKGSMPDNIPNLQEQRDAKFVPKFEELYALLAKGPVYAQYNVNWPDTHLIVVTGIDILNGLVYTNNPWGRSGIQTYEEFLNGFLGNSKAPILRVFYTK